MPSDEQLAKIVLADRVIADSSGLSQQKEALLRELAKKPTGARSSDPSVRERVAKHRLREFLAHHFKYTTEGRRQPKKLTLPRKSVDLIIEDNRRDLTCVEHLWDAHCVGRPASEALRIIYTEPLFFLDKRDHRYVRFLDINCDTSTVSEADIARARELLGADEIVPSFHYQPSGEIGARNRLLAWLRNYEAIKEEGRRVESKASRLCTDGQWSRGNIILLGNRRTNTCIRKLQEVALERPSAPAILIDDHCVRVRAADGEPPFEDSRTHAFALVSRMPNLFPPGIATFIAANHGRAAEKVAEFLTTEESLKELYATHGLDRERDLPSSFQIVFKVDLYEYDEPVRVSIGPSSLWPGPHTRHPAPDPTPRPTHTKRKNERRHRHR